MHKGVVRIGTRGSALALAQANEVKRALEKKNPRLKFELTVIKTFGDEFQGVEIFRRTNVGVFTKAIEKSLLAGKVDLAIHSLKDLPTDLVKGSILAAIPKRADSRDALLSRGGYTLQSLPKGARVGTGSPRRKRQLARLRPDLKLVDLRGNLNTRVKRVLEQRSLDAIVIARAGLLRIKKFSSHARTIPVGDMLPAVGQGALAIQCRKKDKKNLKVARSVHHRPTEKETAAERVFLKELRGGCRVPVGISTRTAGGRFYMKAAVFSVNNDGWVAGDIAVAAARALLSAKKLARTLLKNGAGSFLKEARA